MKKLPTLLLAPSLFAASLYAETLYTQNFDSLNLGALPSSPRVFTGQVAPAGTTANIIEFDGGRAIRLVDTSTGGRPVIEHNFVADANSNIATARFDFTVKLNDPLGTDGNVLQIGLGSFNTNTSGYFFSTPTARSVDFRLLRNGRYMAGLQTSPSALNYGEAGVNFSIFANSGPDAVDYTGPDGVLRSLTAGRYSVFIQDSLVTLTINSTPTNQFGFANANTTGFGRLSFGTGTSNGAVNLDFTIDNIAVSNFASAIPEPSTFAAVSGLLALGVTGLRRRRG